MHNFMSVCMLFCQLRLQVIASSVVIVVIIILAAVANNKHFISK